MTLSSTSPSPFDDGRLPTPPEIVGQLSRWVEGQGDVLRAVALALYTHMLAHASGSARKFGRQHTLLLGPTGTGKTYILKRACEILGLPFYHGSAADLVEAGYAGARPESLLSGLLTAADGDLEQAQRGVVFVDEIDKIYAASGLARDVSGRGVQNTLLSFLDGRKVQVPTQDRGMVDIDTTGVLFVAAGAFVGLDEIRRRRQGGDELGFASSRVDADTLRPIEAEDLVEFGIIPELVGRFATVAELEHLNAESLARILTKKEDSTLAVQQEFFRAHGIELRVTRQALRALAEKALARGTGARGLDATVLDALRPLRARIWDLGEEGVQQILLTKAAALGRREARLVKGDPQDEDTREDEPALSPAAAKADELEQTLELAGARKVARDWWSGLRDATRERPEVFLELARELVAREATVEEFFEACRSSGVTSSAGNLLYLEYLRVKRREKGGCGGSSCSGSGKASA